MVKIALVDVISDFITSDSIQGENGKLALLFNNPGLMRWWPETKIGTSALGEQYAFFKTPELGRKALNWQISIAIKRNLTMQEFIGGVKDYNEIPIPGRYVGFRPELRNPNDYARSLCTRLSTYYNRPLDIELPLNKYFNA